MASSYVIRGKGVDSTTPTAPNASRKNVSLLHKRYLQIHLGELRLPVSAQVLIAEAADNLKIPVKARDHEDLLEQLRRLRQGIEVAGMHPAGDQVIPRALRGRSRHERGLDFKKTLVRQALSHRPRDLMAELKIPLHLLPAQIDVAIFQPQFFIGNRLFRRGKRRNPGVV